MASAQKTPFLGLNQWLGTDKPKREDFNRDNLNTETKVRTHCENGAMHITAQERDAWNKNLFTIGTYTGNGVGSTRVITLGYQPRLLFIYAVGRTLLDYRGAADSTSVYSAMYTPNGASFGLEVTATGFVVRNNAATVSAGNTLALNQLGVTYSYVVFK